MKYSPSLDGLRAVAILPVLVFHALPGSLRGGFSGVDVFFVLSGYLITSVILHDMRGGDFSMREFYLRRIQRLLPNAIAMIFVTLAIALLVLPPTSAVRVATHGLWTLFNLSNVHIWQSIGGYWGESAASVPLLHTWSLAVEEQFYMVFPLALVVLAHLKRVSLFSVIVCLTVASFLLGAFRTGAHPESTFYLLPTRAWEPLLGAALAAYRMRAGAEQPARRRMSAFVKEMAGWIGLALVTAGFLFINESDHFPGWIALVPALGTLAVLLSIADDETRTARVLSAPFMVVIGRLSYSIYLWHWPLIVIGRTFAEFTGRSPQTGALVGAVIGVALSLAAYKFVEAPLRRRGPGRRRRLFVVAAGFCLCAIACLVVSVRRPVADPLGTFDRPAFAGLRYDVAGSNTPEQAASSTRYSDVLFAEPAPLAPEAWKNGGIVHAWGGGSPRVVVLGSSHALMYGGLIDDICRQQALSVAFLSADNTTAFVPTEVREPFSTVELARSFDAARERWLTEWNPDAVIVIDRWDGRLDAPAGFEHRIRELAEQVGKHARRVIVFGQVPVLRLGETVNLREFVTWHLRTTGTLPRIPPDAAEPNRVSAHAAIERVARAYPKLEFLRADQPFYSEDGSVRYASGRSFLYADDDHLSQAGAELVRDACARAIAAACAR